MTQLGRVSFGVIVTALLAAQAPASARPAEGLPTRRIADLALLNAGGNHHRLFRYKADKGLVLYAQRIGCPIVAVNLPKMAALRARFEAEGIRFLIYNSAGETREELKAWAAEYRVDLPILRDPDQLLLNELDVDRSGVVTLIDSRRRRVVFQGALDDQSDYEAQKPQATKHFLADAIEALVAGRDVAVPVADSLGCLMTPLAPEVPLAADHYAARVAPVLREKCVTCHRPQGAGPFAFSSHLLAQRWAAMSKETVLNGRMPPHDADPEIGHFAFDRSLTGAERRDLVRWIDAGAPRGEGPDPLEAPLATPPEWPDGTPDLILTVPPYQVPATGVIDYLYPSVPTGLTRDTWVRRVVVLPTSEAVTHHVLAFLEPFDDRRPAGLTADDWVGVYSPGVDLSTGGIADSSRGDAALLMPARSTVYLQVHYTTVGKPVANSLRLGIYFHKGTPKYRIRTMGLPSDVRIPPGAADHAAAVSHTLKDDIILYGMYPHMHYRGSRAKYTLDTPGKGSEVLLSVPRYRFNWQTIYYLAEPRRVPAGATMHFTGAFDNSSDNPLNPDPTKTVTFGNQSWDEMFIGYLVYGVPAR
jgi:hypothetical protein